MSKGAEEVSCASGAMSNKQNNLSTEHKLAAYGKNINTVSYKRV